MNKKKMQEFVIGILNTQEIRDILRNKVELIDKLENLDCLDNLRLVKLHVSGDDIFAAKYEAVASNEIYPHLKSRLIEKGVATRKSVFRSGVENKDKLNEYEFVTMSFSGGSIQVELKAYNPDYEME